MSTTPPASGNSRRVAAGLVWAGWVALVLITAIGFTAQWLPAADLINDVRPLAALVALALFVLAVGLRDWRLIRPTAALALLHAGLLLLPWARAADRAGGPPALRLVSIDLGVDDERFDDVADFILGAGADIVLLQQVSCSAAERLIPKLEPAFANAFVSADGCAGQALLAKRPWSAVGQTVTAARKPLLMSASFQWDKVAFTLIGASLSGPLAPAAQADEFARLRAYLASQGPAQIVAGALNLTPFTWKIAQLQNDGFGQHATYLATAPDQWPMFLLDNVLSTEGIASVRVTTGPALGTEHRPLIADIAFAK
ncbi:MAG TPA: endonuclease/exonuclease/phosphatase family protein [Xanthobacteraceae bacterium]|nr:endonuclease/exonuclease/phosphatase family protein [Xanthobacteraceae bacterium]